MSKSLGNVVNPDDVVNEYGADTLRLYEMFIGDFEKAAPWNTSSIKGCKRFLDKIWSMSEKLVPGEGVRPCAGGRCQPHHQEGRRGYRRTEGQHRHRPADDLRQRAER